MIGVRREEAAPCFLARRQRGTGREQTSDGAERRAGREGPSGRSRSHESWGGGAWKGSVSVADQPAKIGTRSMVETEGT